VAAVLDFTMPGQLKNLHWRPLAERALGPDEIEIQPKAVGLNFRDVMYAMGLLSDEAVENGFAGATLGMELSGVVTRVGAEVEEFAPGDAVVAFAPACFASRVITKAGSAALKPEAWSFEEAATVPTVFFTVYYALHYLARLQPGEKVLIHGAAGGVGIAAIQVARYLGAEIFATAGSDEKRDFVNLLGADHIMNSRTLAYADEVMALTGGQGIDVVLNSLAGEAINRNFRILRPFGRFLELGKRDFYENTKIGLRPFKDNITYYGIDADQLMVERPALATSLFREVMALFAEGSLRPLPYRAFPAPRVVEAFRYMQASRQIGKVVVTFDDTPLPVVERTPAPQPLALSRDATYMVTGGIGGFGQRTARWLAEQGAGHLVLLSRRGAKAPGAEEAKAELEALGAQVHLKACDVTDASQVKRLLDEIQGALPPLKGIVHAAMVLDDGLIRNLDRDRFLRAMAPKIQGAWNLHRASQGRALDFFVLYSSATTFIGNPGQANYVAANMYLESLAAARQAQGLPATCVAWGAISDVGYLARNEEIKDALQSRLGGHALASDQALERLGAMMQAHASGVAVIDFDWHTLNRFLPATRSPRFDELRRMAGKGGGEAASGEDIHALLAGSTPEEAQGIIRDLLLEEVAAILRLPKERIDTERSLYDLGMDSLMGVELVLGIEKRFGISLPVMALTEGPTIQRISERLVTSLLHGETGVGTPPKDQLADMVSSVAAQHAVEASAEDVAQAVADLRAQTGAGAQP
jgi:NADPH:quinone reductase-like Zn-dependent oxidoreductase/short-subunit dehydrogenase/acyl carrier protein